MHPALISSLYRESRHHIDVGRYEIALEMLESIIAQSGKSPELMIDVVKCCQKLRLREKMTACIEELQLQFQQQGAALDHLGEEWQKLGLYAEALATFRMMQDCRSVPERAVGAARESALHLRMSSMAEAEEALIRAESYGGEYPEVLSARAMWLMRTSPQEALPLLRKISHPHPQIPAIFTAAHGHHLAHVLDQLGQYDDAMVALLHAKDAESRSNPLVKTLRAQASTWQQWHRDATHFTKAQAQQWSDETTPWNNHAFLLGHPRSGTTLLEQILDAHENLSSLEETNLYSQCIDARLMSLYEQSTDRSRSFADFVREKNADELSHYRSEYMQRLRLEKTHARKTQLYLDKNPGLSISVARFAKTMPHSPIIYAVRDPRDVCISAFFQWCDRTPWSNHWLTLEATVAQCVFTHELWQKTQTQLVQPWCEIRYEDIVDDLETWGKKATQFLGLSWQENQLHPAQHARSKVVKSPTHQAVQKDPYTHAKQRWKHYKRWLKPHAGPLAPLLQHYHYEPMTRS